MQLMHLFHELRGRLRQERGFTMYAVMAGMLAIMVLSVAAFAAASSDQVSARRDQDSKRAYSAAEAGINDYLSHLNQDNAYWAKCSTPPAPAVVNNYNDNPLLRVKISGNTDAEYAIELLPAKDAVTGQRAPKCDKNNSSKTMIDPKSGTFQIRSTGYARGTKRTIIATFRHKNFLDFIYFTDLETANPVTYLVNAGGNPTVPDVQQWATNNCSSYYRVGRNATYTGTAAGTNLSFGCTEINFITGDNINGPMHTNDQMLICGTPGFGRDINDLIEVSDPNGWRGNANACGTDTPNFIGKYTPGSPVLALPPSNNALKTIADPAYIFTGRTTIQLTGNSLKVNGVSMAYPPEGIIYVQNGATCGVTYDPTKTDPSQTPSGCGDAYVSGPYNNDLTITAEKDIIINGNINKGADSVLGLIANNFVRVDHPVTNRTKTWTGGRYDWDCQNNGSTPNQIDAAILALNYSFIVDNWYCGNSLGDLNVDGAIAQKYRGIVGTFGGSPTGYLKDYNYDDRLRYRQPPHFLDPVQTAWRVLRETEQTPPR
jgi:Tfp pilus assembly protein PilX